MVLKSAYITETNGRNYVTSRLDTFIQIDNLGVELLAKTFQSLITQSADYNFAETSAFLGNVSHTAETNPAGMGRLASQLKHVDDETKEKLADLKLNPDQTTKSDSVFMEAFRAQDKIFEEMRASGGQPDREAMREKMQKLNGDRDEKLKKIFTEDQFKKWKDEIEPSLRPQRRNNGGGGGNN